MSYLDQAYASAVDASNKISKDRERWIYDERVVKAQRLIDEARLLLDDAISDRVEAAQSE
jgi:hypothetical protein